MAKGKGMHLEGYGLISIVVSNIDKMKYFKWRLRRIAVNNGCLYHEFYEWEIKERKPRLGYRERSKNKNKKIEKKKRPKNEERDFTKSISEDFSRYDFWLNLIPSKENREKLKEDRKIKSIKVYNWIGNFDDFFGMIDIETETGRRIVISENDKVDGYDLIIDDDEYINDKHK